MLNELSAVSMPRRHRAERLALASWQRLWHDAQCWWAASPFGAGQHWYRAGRIESKAMTALLHAQESLWQCTRYTMIDWKSSTSI
jgi:hypothetical protein